VKKIQSKAFLSKVSGYKGMPHITDFPPTSQFSPPDQSGQLAALIDEDEDKPKTKKELERKEKKKKRKRQKKEKNNLELRHNSGKINSDTLKETTEWPL